MYIKDKLGGGIPKCVSYFDIYLKPQDDHCIQLKFVKQFAIQDKDYEQHDYTKRVNFSFLNIKW